MMMSTILRRLRYSKKRAYGVISFVTVAISTAMIIMSQKWQPYELTTTTTTIISSTLPSLDTDQVYKYL